MSEEYTVEPLEPRRLLSVTTMLRIDAGGNGYRDTNGHTWAADTGGAFTGGTRGATTADIIRTTDDVLYRTYETGRTLRFARAVPNGTYTLELRFVDPTSAFPGQRTFDVGVEGRQLMNDVDLAATVGRLRAYTSVSKVTVADGTLNVNFYGARGDAIVSGIALYAVTGPSAPINLRGMAPAAGQLNLYWTDTTSKETGFLVERAPATTGSPQFVQIAKPDKNSQSFSDPSLPASTSYMYRVRAYHKIDAITTQYSDYSDVVSNTTNSANPNARPGSTNTGPFNASVLRGSGSITIKTDGAVVENLDVTGSITVEAKSVFIRNVRVRATGNFCINVLDGGSCTVEDGDLDGRGVTASIVSGSDFTARRLNLHDSAADGFNVKGGVWIDKCWVHALGRDPTSHADGVQMNGGDGLDVTRSFFDMPVNQPGTSSNSAVFLKEDQSSIQNVLVDGNWLNGGNYTIYSLKIGNCKITNNFFGRNYRFGLLTFDGSVTWTNNRWLDTAATIPKPA